ncbi:MAG: SUMF1/EgtB/PvdO family nonheme iron enzyme [Marinilabiliaceae bacterium]|nr:SUMF1/EgtB/PvdO family nonheme iron enzyme [Bacteroidales bacterium]MDD5816565.1 SUMF1/EgtB/PvdO family nonheme iron enzyme [Bacteroidales bacterium]MDY4520116.1 SUMF1/EgtB/PvdO family nonheme iron enzyme [Bacteroidales bacterium]
MKRNVALYAVALIALSGCDGTNQGELVGVERGAQFYEPEPYGMIFVPQGSFNMGQNEQDVASLTNALTKTVTVRSFWMDETEITNSEYRQFVTWVRDSIAREKLAEVDEEFKITEDENGEPLDEEDQRLNWDKELDYDEPDYKEALAELYYGEDERFFKMKDFDNRQWVYEYYWVDLQQAAKLENRYIYDIDEQQGSYHGVVYDINGEERNLEDGNRSAFIMKDRVLVYPDTLCWIQNFTYSYNEPASRMYFWHPGYDTYPCVGISWKQATAFCIWRSNLLNNYLRKEGQPLAMDYRLPTEAEWEYASRGGLEQGIYPWGGYYTRNNRGCFVANFKPLRGRYTDDGSAQTSQVASYAPNEYGLYDMAGNVAEWTSSAFDESAYVYTHDMNPDYKYNALPDDPVVMKRKVLRGGSWKDIAYYLQCGTRSYEYQDSSSCYIGFRCVRDYIGE